jgi:hypothetical protein
MPSIFDTMSSSERNKLADTLLASAESLSADERKVLIAKLTEALSGELKAAADNTKKKTVMQRIQAARDDVHSGGNRTLTMVDGSLRRADVEPLESLALKEPHEINKILASAPKLTAQDKMAAKSLLFRLGAIPA